MMTLWLYMVGGSFNKFGKFLSTSIDFGVTAEKFSSVNNISKFIILYISFYIVCSILYSYNVVYLEIF